MTKKSDHTIEKKKVSAVSPTQDSDTILSNFSSTIPRISKTKVTKSEENSAETVVSELDSRIAKRDRTEIEYESDKGYREISEKIIQISSDYLANEHDNKKELRRNFGILFSILISLQYAFIVVAIVLNACLGVSFYINQEILKLYIISVFVETLSAIGIMIVFAFASKDETTIISVLNNVIEHYQKFNIDKTSNDKNDNSKNDSSQK